MMTVACTSCGLFRVDPLPSTREVEQFHELDYRSSYKGVRTPKRKHIYRSGMLAVQRFRHLAKYLGQHSAVLDIGCASGEWLYILGKKGHSAVGIEVDRSYAEFGRNEYSVDIRSGSVNTFECSDRKFECITLFHVLEHLPDPLAALARISGWLKHEGHLAIEVPNVNSPYQHPVKRFHSAHVVGYTPESLSYVAQKSGWRIVELSLDAHERNIFAVLDKRSDANCGTHDRLSFPRSPVVPSTVSATVHYYMRPSTYIRSFERLKQFGAEFRAAKKEKTPRELLNSSLRNL